ncbi:MAG: hypothetical protein F4Y02_17935, partial [Chloroflexi bacterium]|nr:hypothetical protein [Chloroflexota bacterium]
AIAAERQFASIAFPAISTGAYGYPLHEATHVAAVQTRNHLESGGDLDRIVFACFSEEVQEVYLATFEDAFGPDLFSTDIPGSP